MIRPYELSDRQAILEIFQLNAPKYFDQAEVRDLETFLDNHGDTYLTIGHQNKIAGGTGYKITNKFFEKLGFDLIRTEKDYWGKGLDLYLMEKEL